MLDTRQYIKEGGVNCVYCHSKNIATVGMVILEGGGGATQSVECHDCGKMWTDCYVLDSVVLEEDLNG